AVAAPRRLPKPRWPIVWRPGKNNNQSGDFGEQIQLWPQPGDRAWHRPDSDLRPDFIPEWRTGRGLQIAGLVFARFRSARRSGAGRCDHPRRRSQGSADRLRRRYSQTVSGSAAAWPAQLPVKANGQTVRPLPRSARFRTAAKFTGRAAVCGFDRLQPRIETWDPQQPAACRVEADDGLQIRLSLRTAAGR